METITDPRERAHLCDTWTRIAVALIAISMIAFLYFVWHNYIPGLCSTLGLSILLSYWVNYLVRCERKWLSAYVVATHQATYKDKPQNV